MPDDKRQRTLAALQRLEGLLVPSVSDKTKPQRPDNKPSVKQNRAARRAEKFAPKRSTDEPSAEG